MFNDVLTEKEIDEFATLVYYPEEKIKMIKNSFDSDQKLTQVVQSAH